MIIWIIKIKRKSTSSKKEENAVVLDYLSRGYVKSDMSKFGGKPIAQAIGTEQFTLLELAPKTGIDLEIKIQCISVKVKETRYTEFLED